MARVPDIRTPTPGESSGEDLRRRKRRYLFMIVPCVVLTVVGFAATPLGVPVRLACCALAAVGIPVAGILANARRR